ncbi:MAG TPA: RDD family protein, partial [Opitutus sp.]|nr:RDD family protein [Opitutus sp.]
SSLGLSLPYLLALFVVQVVLLSWRSQSIGNILLRTRIVRVSDDQPGGFLRAFLLRGFLARIFRQVPVFGFFFWLTDSLFIFRDDKRCLHDLIAGTKVIKV